MGLTLREIGLGWSNPGRPVELLLAALLVTMLVEATAGGPASLCWDLYVKVGMLVTLTGPPLSTAACELNGRAGVGVLDEAKELMVEDDCTWLGDGEGLGKVLEMGMAVDEAAGAGVGVK